LERDTSLEVSNVIMKLDKGDMRGKESYLYLLLNIS
jgi:hypothetical protein